ncbi:hypothetical protein RHGRI_006319 [Rhododendron griersonianum]|uniref:Uncharacterized protein n=1 Tax=Rhododendron griersonianum TaxID=479676 RepID=A0AAV6KSM3_9ERIC|nr:hypothetical protein RHGRI_006319 [Rhododendron griersonianum]
MQSKGKLPGLGKVQISTNFFGAINQGINLEVNGRLYPIRVVEEQFVVNNMIRAKEEDDWIDTPAKDNHLADEGLGVGIEQETILGEEGRSFTSPIFQVLKSNIKGSRNASKALDFGARLGIKIVGGRNYNLKKWVEMEEEEIAERENALKKLAELEEGNTSD